MSKPLELAHFLGPEKTREIELALSELAALGATNYVGVWDAGTGFGLVVEVLEGKPFQWHLRGPLNREGAATWLGMVQAEIVSNTGGESVH